MKWLILFLLLNSFFGYLSQKINKKIKKRSKWKNFKMFFSLCFIVHLLDGLFRRGSRHNYLSQRQGNVYCTISFGSIRHNLLITFLFLLLLLWFLTGQVERMFAELVPTCSYMYLLPLIKPSRDDKVSFKLYCVC